MVNFVDKTSTQSGTPLNRRNMMAIQGFEGRTITFEGDTIKEEYQDGSYKIIGFSGNVIREMYYAKNSEGAMIEVLKKTTGFSENQITEVLI